MNFKETHFGSDKPIEYIGSAMSDFQGEPILYGPYGEMLPPVSDWEIEIQKNLNVSPSGVAFGQKKENLPRFLKNKEKYFDRSKELGENMFRLSLDFARLCPEPEQFNEAHMAEYVKAIATIKAGGQEPMITINHFTMPRYLIETNARGSIIKGGWENPDVSKHFKFYIENVTRFLGDEDKVRNVLIEAGFDKESQDKFLAEGLVKYFISINEPMTICLNGYLAGVFPPFKKGGVLLIKKVLERMVEAHDMTREELKKIGTNLPADREPQIGAAYNWQHYDGIFGGITRSLFSEMITDPFERNGAYSDFLGFQYYFRKTVPYLAKQPDGRDYGDHNTFGDMYPPGIFEELKRMNERYPQKEIFITEMGFAEKSDKRKPYWILETVRYILEAKKQGVPIKGMLLWSLVNNLEWDLGMNTEFGMFDEKDLDKPLAPETEGVKSWQVWQAITKTLTNPSPKALNDLQTIYDEAKKQYSS